MKITKTVAFDTTSFAPMLNMLVEMEFNCPIEPLRDPNQQDDNDHVLAEMKKSMVAEFAKQLDENIHQIVKVN